MNQKGWLLHSWSSGPEDGGLLLLEGGAGRLAGVLQQGPLLWPLRQRVSGKAAARILFPAP